TKKGEQLIQEIGVRTYNIKHSGRRLLLSEGKENLVLVQPTVMDESAEVGFNIASILRGLVGLAMLILIAWLFSSNRRGINWSLIAKGTALQIIIALLVLKVPAVEYGFSAVSEMFVKLIGFTDTGI